MNQHLLLAMRFVLTLLVLVVVAALGWISATHQIEGAGQRIVDGLMGGMITLLTGNCFAWFFNGSAGATQANATVAKQAEMLAAAAPVQAP